MNCAETQQYLSERALDIAAPPTRQAVDLHLTECAACARVFAEARAAASGLTAILEHDEVSPAPRADVSAILERARRSGGRTRPAAAASAGSSRSRVLRWLPLAAGVLFAAVGVAGAMVATAQTRALDERMQQFTGLLLEEARSEARKSLFPLLQQFDATLDARDEVQQQRMQRLCEWVEQARAEDRSGISNILTDTREDLARTQFALRTVAEQVPLIR